MALGYGKRAISWEDIGEGEKKRMKGFKILEEFPTYYLCGKFDKNGNLLYRECFSRFDIDERETRPRERNIHLPLGLT